MVFVHFMCVRFVCHIMCLALSNRNTSMGSFPHHWRQFFVPNSHHSNCVCYRIHFWAQWSRGTFGRILYSQLRHSPNHPQELRLQYRQPGQQLHHRSKDSSLCQDSSTGHFQGSNASHWFKCSDSVNYSQLANQQCCGYM